MTQFGNEDLQNPMTNNPFQITAEELQAASRVKLALFDCKFPKTAIRLANQPPCCVYQRVISQQIGSSRLNMSNVNPVETVWGQQMGSTKFISQAGWLNMLVWVSFQHHATDALQQSPIFQKHERFYAVAKWTSTDTNSWSIINVRQYIPSSQYESQSCV